MSNDLIANLKSELADAQGGLDEDTLAVAGGKQGTANKRISIKGGVFRKYAGGKEIGAIEDRFMNIIFVKMAHNTARTFYSQSYKEGEKISPACWSSDSKVPDAEVRNPQAKSCDSCQQSVKGSGQGGTGSACRLSWRTAVVLPNDPSGDVMQLVLPATSCFGKEESGKWPFRPYVQMLASNNISAGRIVTKMQFDTKSPVPKLVFSPVSSVPAEDIPKIQLQRDSAATENAIKLTVFQSDEGYTSVQAPTQVEVQDGEPKLRDTSKSANTAPVTDAVDVVKKWSKK